MPDIYAKKRYVYDVIPVPVSFQVGAGKQEVCEFAFLCWLQLLWSIEGGGGLP